MYTFVFGWMKEKNSGETKRKKEILKKKVYIIIKDYTSINLLSGLIFILFHRIMDVGFFFLVGLDFFSSTRHFAFKIQFSESQQEERKKHNNNNTELKWCMCALGKWSFPFRLFKTEKHYRELHNVSNSIDWHGTLSKISIWLEFSLRSKRDYTKCKCIHCGAWTKDLCTK